MGCRTFTDSGEHMGSGLVSPLQSYALRDFLVGEDCCGIWTIVSKPDSSTLTNTHLTGTDNPVIDFNDFGCGDYILQYKVESSTCPNCFDSTEVHILLPCCTLVGSSSCDPSCITCANQPRPLLTCDCIGNSGPVSYKWTSPTGAMYFTDTVTANVSGQWTWTCTENMNCFKTGNTIVTIIAQPAVTITAANGCVGAEITLSASGVPFGYTYSWSMPTGSPSVSTSLSPSVNYSTTGTKTITLTINNNTCEYTYSKNITISQLSGSSSCN